MKGNVCDKTNITEQVMSLFPYDIKIKMKNKNEVKTPQFVLKKRLKVSVPWHLSEAIS